MNRSCVVRAHGAGLFSNINKVLTCMRIYEHVHVDWSTSGPNDPAFKYGGSFYGNCWDALFEPTTPPEPPFDTISEYPFYEITGGCAGVLYQNEQWGWRERYHEAWNKLQCRVMADPMAATCGTLGILVRSDNIAGEQLSGRNQTLEEYATQIEKVIGGNDLFIVSSDEESVRYFKGKYKSAWSNSIKRSVKRSDPEQHIHTPQTKEDAVQVMQEVLMLSNCYALIHGVSNMATAALYMNLNLKSIYLR